MEIKLDIEAVAGIASAAIFDSLSQDSRDSIIQQALQFLLTPEKIRNYSAVAETPLQQAFNQAIRETAFKVVREKIEEDPQVNEGIQKLLGPLLNAALKSEGEVYDSSLANALGTAMGVWLSDKAREGRESD